MFCSVHVHKNGTAACTFAPPWLIRFLQGRTGLQKRQDLQSVQAKAGSKAAPVKVTNDIDIKTTRKHHRQTEDAERHSKKHRSSKSKRDEVPQVELNRELSIKCKKVLATMLKSTQSCFVAILSFHSRQDLVLSARWFSQNHIPQRVVHIGQLSC